ncbi:hypothetical protein HK096_001408, partial [Nowakowskiella sp. JEL0078]
STDLGLNPTGRNKSLKFGHKVRIIFAFGTHGTHTIEVDTSVFVLGPSLADIINVGKSHTSLLWPELALADETNTPQWRARLLDAIGENGSATTICTSKPSYCGRI